MKVARHVLPALFASAVVSALAQDAPGSAAAVLASCAGEGRLDVQAIDERAMLDANDRAALTRAMVLRYPMLGRDGFAPAAILMWRRPGGAWLYVTLSRRDDASEGWCFSASFTASVFEITPALARKYFVGSSKA